MAKSPQQKLAKIFNLLLEPVLNHNSRFVFKDSLGLIQRVRDNYQLNTFLFSFGVRKTLYKCFIGLGYTNLCKVLYSLRKLSIKKTSFIKLMKIATSDVQFSFDYEIYNQINVIAMGLLSGLLSLISLLDIKNLNWLISYHPKFLHNVYG